MIGGCIRRCGRLKPTATVRVGKPTAAMLAAVGLLLSACSGTSSGTGPPGPTPPPGATHLYVADVFDGALLIYTLPISNSSTPTALSTSTIFSVATDPSSSTFADSAGGSVALFTRPITSSSTPFATLGQGTASSGYAFFANSGKLYVSTNGPQVNVFTPPFVTGNLPTTITNGAGPTSSLGIAFDSASNLYVTNNDGTHAVDAFAPPYSSAPLVITNAGTALRDCVVIGQQLFVSDVADVSGGQITVYDLPLTVSSTPAFEIANGTDIPEGLATDGGGNLYVNNSGNGAIAVYTPPFGAGSSPVIYLDANSGVGGLFGLAIGS